jgi:hypothetical protein
LEVQWTHSLLPYAEHGANAAGLYLKCVSRASRKSNLPNMCIVQESEILLRRAILDYVAQLERFRLNCQWLAAQEAVYWMTELDISPPSSSPEVLHIEHIFNTQFWAWRLWASWRPDVVRITRLLNMDSTSLWTVLDIAALEGPDMMNGAEQTLRQTWIARYEEATGWTQYHGLTVELPECTKSSLATTLKRLVQGLNTVSASTPSSESIFELFRELTVSQTVTTQGLDLFEAAVKIPYTPENDFCKAIREVWHGKDNLHRFHVLSLRKLICILDEP